MCLILYMSMNEVYVFLNNIRSAHNVGSIFRTADGAGVSKIILGGYTPAPVDRFGRSQKEIEKTSLGAVSTVPFLICDNEEEMLKKLKEEEFTIVAVEQTKDAISLSEFKAPEKVVYIFGNEIDGVEHSLLDLVDQKVMIPMQGTKESLNVAVCAGIILFH